MEHQINVYDLNWNLLGKFWSGSDYGIKEDGGYVTGYTKANQKVFLKRMN